MTSDRADKTAIDGAKCHRPHLSHYSGGAPHVGPSPSSPLPVPAVHLSLFELYIVYLSCPVSCQTIRPGGDHRALTSEFSNLSSELRRWLRNPTRLPVGDARLTISRKTESWKNIIPNSKIAMTARIMNRKSHSDEDN